MRTAVDRVGVDKARQVNARLAALATMTCSKRRSVTIQDLWPDEKRLASELAATPYTTANDAIEAAYAALPSTRGATSRRRRAGSSEGADEEMGIQDLPVPLFGDRDEPTSDVLRGGHDGRGQVTPQIAARLLDQVQGMVRKSEEPVGFDAAAWLSRWLSELVPALGGARPIDLLSTPEGEAWVSTILARIQSGAYS